MKTKRKVICLILAVFMGLGLWTPVRGNAADATPEGILASMTTQEKIAQMLMVSIRYLKEEGQEKQFVTELNDDLSEYLAENHFGGVILFAENVTETEQAVRLIDSLQAVNLNGGGKAQLMISMDQEGGKVTRPGECVQGPGNMALTATGKKEDVSVMGSIIGKEMAALGVNVDFCPDSDVNCNPANPVIGVRSFSDDPEIVAEYGKIMLEALSEEAVIGAPKHFPGHGDTDTDSHTGLPKIDKTLDELKTLELVPFQAEIDAGAEMIMTAHIQYPEIEKGTYTSISTGEDIYLPATLSKTIVTDVLRGEMGYDGVVITDAMDMDAIAKHFNPVDAAELAINAGVDILLMMGNLSSAKYRGMLAAGITQLAMKADQDEKMMAKVDAAVLRILKLKEKYGLLEAYDPTGVEDKVANAKRVVSTKANHDIEWDITKRAMTLVKNDDHTLPLTDAGEKTVILTAYDDEPLPMNYAIDLLRQEERLPEGAEYEVHSFKGKEAQENRQEVLGWIEGADNVIAISEMGKIDFLSGDSAALIDELIAKTHEQSGKFILMSVDLPYDVARFQDADAILITYGARSMNMDPREDTEPMKRFGSNMAAGLYMMLQDEESPTGKLPVNLPKLNAAKDGFEKEILYSRGFGLTYYSEEWVDGLWYSRNGQQTYAGKGSWAQSGKGWWFGDTYGWYAKKTWQKIDGSWYYFDADGYMEKNAYRKGCFLGKNGAWNGETIAAGWLEDENGWKYVLSGEECLTACWMKIDGKWYYFKADGYAAQNEFVSGWWIGKNCVQSDTTHYSWHKTGKGWWYGVKDGWYAKKTTITIDGIAYTFDKNGYCINP